MFLAKQAIYLCIIVAILCSAICVSGKRRKAPKISATFRIARPSKRWHSPGHRRSGEKDSYNDFAPEWSSMDDAFPPLMQPHWHFPAQRRFDMPPAAPMPFNMFLSPYAIRRSDDFVPFATTLSSNPFDFNAAHGALFSRSYGLPMYY